MPHTLHPTASPDHGRVRRSSGPPRRWEFFLAENLLEARAESRFPTNGAGPDEDVNIYLTHLLARFLRGHHDERLLSAGQPHLRPPSPAADHRTRAEFYRVNAEHRLLFLGLFDRGDGQRRRHRFYGASEAETRRRDLLTGQTCFAAAANHLRPKTPADRALIDIWQKLAAHFTDYVHVLGVLATRRLGLGCCLDETALGQLVASGSAAVEDEGAVAALLEAAPPSAAWDDLLDLWLQNRKNPDPATTARLGAMANRLGVQLSPGTGRGNPSTVAEGNDLVE